MKNVAGLVLLFCNLLLTRGMRAQAAGVEPQIRTHMLADGKVTVVEVLAHFVTAVRLPEPVNSVVVGDPTLFQVEYNEHEPELVFVKALTSKPAESNLLVSTTRGRQISLLLVSEKETLARAKVDFLLRYKPSTGFLIEQETVPAFSVGETASLSKMPVLTNFDLPPTEFPVSSWGRTSRPSVPAETQSQSESLDQLLDRQKQAPLPALFGERREKANTKGDLLRAGISQVIDSGLERVVVLFSVVNTSKHRMLLMPPQIQLGGTFKSGKLVKHDRWLDAEQLPVIDFRLSRRRIGSEERADGVAVFERPPYKQSNQTLFLQVAESGAVDRPTLVPIGFGVSTAQENADHGTPNTER